MKPRLPPQLEKLLPREIVHEIYKFVPHTPQPKPPSPGLQEALLKIQRGGKKGSSMYLKDLDDFVLD